MSTALTSLAAWRDLREQRHVSRFDLRQLFASDPLRFKRYTIAQGELLLDYSKHYVNEDTMDCLVALADALDLREWIRELMTGERINVTENRPAYVGLLYIMRVR